MNDAYVMLIHSSVDDDETPSVLIVGPFAAFADAKAFSVRPEVIKFAMDTRDSLHCWVGAWIVGAPTAILPEEWFAALNSTQDNDE